MKAILLIGILATLEMSCARTADVPSPTGQMVDIGGRKLHIHCTGKGAPTVIVENGGAAFSFDWELVQPKVERFTRICTYDRAGYAWSDVGPEFDTFDQSVHDLHILLSKAGIAGPYVLVGHSFGGLLVRFYQATYPSSVVGMVLVDSSHEESLQQVGPKAVRIPELTADQYKALIDEGKANRPSNPAPDLVPETIFPPYDRLPAQFQTLHLWALRKVLPLVKTWGLSLQYDLSRLREARADNPRPLGKMPLVVLTASDFNVAQVPGVTADTLRQDHLRLQDDLASLSTDRRHVMVAGSGHEIYLYKPAVVVQSISAVVTSVRSESRLSPIN